VQGIQENLRKGCRLAMPSYFPSRLGLPQSVAHDARRGCGGWGCPAFVRKAKALNGPRCDRCGVHSHSEDDPIVYLNNPTNKLAPINTYPAFPKTLLQPPEAGQRGMKYLCMLCYRAYVEAEDSAPCKGAVCNAWCNMIYNFRMANQNHALPDEPHPEDAPPPPPPGPPGLPGGPGPSGPCGPSPRPASPPQPQTLRGATSPVSPQEVVTLVIERLDNIERILHNRLDVLEHNHNEKISALARELDTQATLLQLFYEESMRRGNISPESTLATTATQSVQDDASWGSASAYIVNEARMLPN
jgi:hypothetical protein